MASVVAGLAANAVMTLPTVSALDSASAAQSKSAITLPASNKSWLAGAVERCQKNDKSFPSVTAYDLRHTAASLAISAGANPKVVQRMLGHASAAMTLDMYADLFDSDVVVAESVAKMWPLQVNSQ